jgi:hypothetical protein
LFSLRLIAGDSGKGVLLIMHINEYFKRSKEIGSLFGGAQQIDTQGSFQKQVGERHEFVLKLSARIPLFEGYYVAVYQWLDRAGNAFVWFAAKDQDYSVGDTYRIRATVKAHKVYAGIKQTHIFRLKKIGLLPTENFSTMNEDAWMSI